MFLQVLLQTIAEAVNLFPIFFGVVTFEIYSFVGESHYIRMRNVFCAHMNSVFLILGRMGVSAETVLAADSTVRSVGDEFGLVLSSYRSTCIFRCPLGAVI
jgi:hypothetical protein